MTQTSKTQQTETLTSLTEHYTDAVRRGDTDRAIDVAEAYRKITGRLITEHHGYAAHYAERWAEQQAIPADELIRPAR